MASAQDDFGILSEDAYRESGTGSPPPGWTRLTVNGLSYASDPNNGFYAVAYGRFNADGTLAEVVVAYRGSDGAGDATSDAQLYASQKPDQYDAAKTFYQDVLTEYGSQAPISLTGHSLGGALASMVAAEQAAAGNLVVANVINAVPVKNSLDDIGLGPNGNYSNIHNYNAVFDPASNVPIDQIGSVETVYISSFPLVPDWFEPFIAALHPRLLFYFLKDQHSISNFVSNDFTSAQTWVQRRDPLTLDLDGDGLETVALNPTNPIYFDHDGDGNATATGWISPDDGFLALDRNANGVIDNGRELFGDATLIPDGSGGERNAVDGFEALQAQDSNADGKVDSQDTNFANLIIWQDLNSDAISQSNELLTLTQKNIASINVAKTENNTLLPNGNVIADLGTYTKTDGTQGTLGDTAQLGDIDLREDTFLSQFTDTIPLTPEAEALPGMQGSGQVRDLREAVSLSSSMATLLTNYSSAAARNGQTAQLDALIRAWSDTSTMATTATGAYVLHALNMTFAGISNGTPEHQAWLDKLTILERFNGRTFRVVPAGTAPVTVSFSSEQMTLLDQSYSALKESAYNALFLQTRGKVLLDAIELTVDAAGNVTLDYAAMQALLTTRLQSDVTTGIYDVVGLINSTGSDLQNAGWQMPTYMATVINILSSTSAGQTILNDPTVLGIAAGNNVLVGDAAANSLSGTAVGEVLLGGGGGDLLLAGGADKDALYGDAGNDSLKGGAGNDTLYGGDAGNDTLDGGTGNDASWDGIGNDTYVFNLGDGQDILPDNDATVGNTDTIRLGAGITASMLGFNGVNHDLVINYSATDTITIKNWFLSNDSKTYRVEQIVFADDTTQNIGDRTDIVNTYTGTESSDTVYGGSESDVFYGLGGGDLLLAGGGNDVLDGADGADNLQGQDGDDVITGGSGADLLLGGNGTDSLDGGADNDALYGDAGNDSLKGGAGNDTLYGGDAGNDTLDGGTGNDASWDGIGNDTYVFNLGDGQDILTDNDATVGNTDTIRLGAGIPASMLGFNGVNHDLVINYSATDTITIKNWFLSNDSKTYRVEQIVFADDTTQNIGYRTDIVNTYTGTESSDTVYGGSESDVFYGLGGGDLLLAGGGNDVLDGADGADNLQGQDGDDVITGGSGADLLLGGNGTDSLDGGADNDALYGDAGNDSLKGGAGNDTLYGGDAGNDTLDGGTGNDASWDGIGNDTYVFNLGDGQDILTDNDATVGNTDTIRLGAGITASMLGFNGVNHDLVINYSATDTITIKNWFLS